MYIRQTQTCVLQIPKCGTHTLKRAMCEVYGKTTHGGHVKLSTMIRNNRDAKEAVAIIRDPLERFVSSLNYDLGDTNTPLEQAMKMAFRTPRKAVYTTQQSYLDVDFPVVLFPFERIGDALQYLGYEGEPIHANKGNGKWSLHDLEPWLPQIEAFISEDYPLREKALAWR